MHFQQPVFVFRRNLYLLASLVAVALAGGLLLGTHRYDLLGLLMTMWGLPVALYVAAKNPYQLRTARVLAADAKGISLNDKLVIERANIVAGYVQPSLGIVCFNLRAGGDFQVEVADVASANELLSVLGLDAGTATASFATSSYLSASRLGPLPRWAVLAFFLFFVSFFHPLQGLAGLFVPVLLVFAMWPARVTVGPDGVLLTWLALRRFYPCSKIRSVTQRGALSARTVLTLVDGSEIHLIARENASRDEERHAQHGALRLRIEGALEAFRQRLPEVDPTSLLAAGGRSAVEWMRSLRAMSVGGGGYRQAALSSEQMWRVVQDPTASPSTRTGAAIALSPSLDEAGRSDLLRAAEACAHPKVRVALTSLAVGASETAVLDALEPLAEEEADQRTKRLILP